MSLASCLNVVVAGWLDVSIINWMVYNHQHYKIDNICFHLLNASTVAIFYIQWTVFSRLYTEITNSLTVVSVNRSQQ